MLRKKLNRSDYILLALYFTVFTLLNIYDYTYFFHQIEYTIVYPDGSNFVQKNTAPELKGYLIGVPISFLFTLSVVLVFYLYLIPKYLIESRNYLLFGLVGVITMFIFGALKLSVWLWINNIPREAYPSFIDFLINGISTSSVNAGLPLGILITKKYYEEQIKNATIEQQRKEVEVNLLRAQINPHFLFNSLNTLDALIDRDPSKAQIYLKALSQLYRNLIVNKDREIIPLQQELETLKSYFTMIKIRFGDAYHFNIIDRPIQENEFLPVAALQILVENVIKHNSPSSSIMITTTIKIEDKLVVVQNNKVAPTAIADSFGTGLKNLEERYKLITAEKIHINQDDDVQFTISIPIISVRKL